MRCVLLVMSLLVSSVAIGNDVDYYLKHMQETEKRLDSCNTIIPAFIQAGDTESAKLWHESLDCQMVSDAITQHELNRFNAKVKEHFSDDDQSEKERVRSEINALFE